MKNIDFTDFFNVFLSGATLWQVCFSPVPPLPKNSFWSRIRRFGVDTAPAFAYTILIQGVRETLFLQISS